MGAANYIGRVGGLAIVLGVGMAVAAAPGVAVATPSDTRSTTESTSESTSESTGSTTPSSESTSQSTADADSGPKKPTVTVGAQQRTPEGADTDSPTEQASRTDADDTSAVDDTESAIDEPAPESSKPNAAERKKNGSDRRQVSVAQPGSAPDTATQTSVVSAQPSSQTNGAPAAGIDTTPAAPPPTVIASPVTTSDDAAPVTRAISSPPADAAPSDSVGAVVSAALALAGFAPVAPGGPATPVDSPVGWAVMALVRRFGQSTNEESSTLRTSPTLTSQPVDEQDAYAAAMVSANSAPTTSPTVSAPNDATGVVAGSLNATDPEGGQLSYAVTGAPQKGSVTIDSAGAFTYTPTQASRLAASQTAGADTDSFTVTVSDGASTQSVTVTVPVSSTQPQLDSSLPAGTSTLGTTPSAVVVGSDGRMYVANTGSGTVSVIDTATGQRIDADSTSSSMDIRVGSSPSALALSPDGKKLYVANTGSNTVSVIDTTTYKMIDTSTAAGVNSIAVGSAPSALVLGPDGRLYVANRGSNTVSVVDTATNKLIDTNASAAGVNSITVGSAPSAMVLGPDGRLYVANRGSNTVSVIDTANYKLIDTNSAAAGVNSVAVGTAPSALTLAPNGRLYVVNGSSGTVSVIDTANYQRIDADPATSSMDIRVGSAPSSIALSPDGSLAYVANGPDTVSVIDTKTNTVVRTVTVDSAAENGGHVLTLSPDGSRIYVSDAYDRKVRALTLVHVNTAPQASQSPTVIGTDPSTGAVTGALHVADIDGDKLTYTTAPGTGPASGTVSYDAVAGTYTYTPTQAARQAAWNTPGDDVDRFTVTVSDGQGGTTSVPVTVTISAVAPPPAQEIPHTTTPVVVGNGPSNVAIANGKAYVVNSYDNTVTVIDTTTNAVVGDPIPVGYYLPSRAVASPTGDRVYVSDYGSVWVIDTSTDAVVAEIPIPVQDGEYYNGVWDMAVSPDGTRLYAARGDSTVSVVDTDPTSPTYHTVIATAPVNFWDGDMEVGTPDGSKLYAANSTGSTVTVLDGDTLATEDYIHIGPQWDLDSMRSETTDSTYGVASNEDGTRLYVTQRVLVVERGVGGQTGWFISDNQGRNWLVRDTYSAVSVIDTDPTSATYNQEIDRIIVPDGAADVAVHGDRAYVTNADGRTVTVIDTTTNAVVGSFTTDPSSGWGTRTVTVDSDGTLYIADGADNTVYVTTL